MMATPREPEREDIEHNNKLDKYDYLRNSRADQRRYIAKEVLIEIIRMTPRGELYHFHKDPDALAKQAEDLAHALMVRLAAREEAEMRAGRFGATE